MVFVYLVGDFFMARRFNSRYFVRLGRDLEFKLSAAEWNDLRAGGWIKPDAPGSRYADLRRGVLAWVRGGDLHLISLKRMPCVTARWFLIWLYRVSVISAARVAETASRRQELALLERERETQNEALVWRTFRGTKGANEFRWISAEHKAEILRALKPEMAPG